MWECNFAGETMDYKLFWLRFVKKIWLIAVVTVMGALLVGVPYYLCNVVFGEGPSYEIVSEYYLDYAQDGSGATYEYFNYYTWSEIADTDEFLTILKEQLPKDVVWTDEELRAYTDATVESDTRYLITTVKTEQADKTIVVTRAMEKAIEVFATNQKELNSAKVVSTTDEAEKTYPDVRPVRAFVLGAVLGLFVGIVGITGFIICDSSVYLPNTMEKRYGVKALGCENFTESKNNICYITKTMKKVALIGVGGLENAKADGTIAYIKDTLNDMCELDVIKESVLSSDFDFEALRDCDGTIILVQAAAKNGKIIERSIEQIRRQDVTISGAFLFGENKKLLKQYYR